VNPHEQLLQVDLDDEERALIASGLNQWGGPAYCTEEMAFGSALIGAAWDWSIVTGTSDQETLAVLRRVQKKLLRHVARVIGDGFGTKATRRRPMFWTPPPVDKAAAASLAGVTVEQLDEWHDAGLLRSRPVRYPDPALWWFGLVVQATVARHLVALGVTTASMVRALSNASHTALIGVQGKDAFRVDPGSDLLPAEPVMVLDIAAVADELRQRWPTGPEVRWQAPPTT
jgi:hypothetical protein